MKDTRKFHVERAKGWWWVTERETGHNYAQCDRPERADEICRELNAAHDEQRLGNE